MTTELRDTLRSVAASPVCRKRRRTCDRNRGHCNRSSSHLGGTWPRRRHSSGVQLEAASTREAKEVRAAPRVRRLGDSCSHLIQLALGVAAAALWRCDLVAGHLASLGRLWAHRHGPFPRQLMSWHRNFWHSPEHHQAADRTRSLTTTSMQHWIWKGSVRSSRRLDGLWQTWWQQSLLSRFLQDLRGLEAKKILEVRAPKPHASARGFRHGTLHLQPLRHQRRSCRQTCYSIAPQGRGSRLEPPRQRRHLHPAHRDQSRPRHAWLLRQRKRELPHLPAALAAADKVWLRKRHSSWRCVGSQTCKQQQLRARTGKADHRSHDGPATPGRAWDIDRPQLRVFYGSSSASSDSSDSDCHCRKRSRQRWSLLPHPATGHLSVQETRKRLLLGLQRRPTTQMTDRRMVALRMKPRLDKAVRTIVLPWRSRSIAALPQS